MGRKVKEKTYWRRLKKKAPKYPDYTCPHIDKILGDMSSSKTTNAKDYKRWERRLEKLRTQNEQLRESGIWWHETCKATVSELYELIEELKYTIKRIEK